MTSVAPAPDGEPDRLAELLRDLPDEGRHRGGRVPFLSVPRSLRSVDLGVGLRAVRGLLVVALVVTAVLAARWAWAERASVPSTEAETVAPGDAGPSGPALTTGAPMDGNGSAATVLGVGPVEVNPSTGAVHEPGPTAVEGPAPDVLVMVHVAGQVGDPGVVEITAGARVVDAVEAAGGFTREADQAALNLARPVVDGEQVWVGRPGETPPVPAPWPGVPSSPGGGSAGAGSGHGGAPGAGVGGGPTGATVLLDLNAATQADLEELPGVGPVTAGQILAWRDAHGRFTRVDELLEVSGIGERTLERLEPLVAVGD